MALKTSLGEIRSSTENPADPVGCGIDHYVLTIVGDSVTKLLNIEPQGRMPVKFRSINSFCSQEKRNNGKDSFVEGLANGSMFSEQTDCDLRSNKLSDGRKAGPSSNENCINSYEIFKIPGTGDITLKELYLRCKAKKQRVKRELMKSATTSPFFEESNESPSEVQLKEPDLSEPLISIKRKRLKRCMDKREMIKARKVCMRVSPLCSSATLVENDVQHITCVEEIIDSNIGESTLQKNSNGKSESELDRFSLSSGRNELVNDIGDELSKPDFHEEHDATDLISDVSDNFFKKSRFSGDQPLGDLHEVPGYSEGFVLMEIDKASSEVKSDASHQVVVELENGSSHEHRKNSNSSDGSRADALPLNEQNDMQCAFNPNEESHIPRDLYSAEAFEDNRSTELQSSENNDCCDNIRINHTSNLNPHFNSQCLRHDSGGTHGVSFPETSDLISPFPRLESCTVSTQLQCHTDNFRTCHSSRTGVLTLSSLMQECNMDSRHTDWPAQTPTSKQDGFLYSNLQTCGSSCESTDQDDDKHDLKMKEMATEDVQNENLNDRQSKHIWHGMCISSGDKESDNIAENVYEEMTPGIWENDLSSGNVSVTTINTPTINGVSPAIATDMLHTIKSSETETVGIYGEVITNSLDDEEFREVEENECRSCQNSYACSSMNGALLPPTNDSKENVSTPILDCDNLGARINCKDPEAPERGEAPDFCKDIKPAQPLRKLPSNRRVFCPSSREKLYQALQSGEFYYKNRRKLSLDKWLDGPPLLDLQEAECKFSPEKVFTKPRNTCCIIKGILKSASTRGCNIGDTSPPSSHSQDAIKFSQRQMHDIESIREKLLVSVKSMKSIMEETLNLEEFASTNLKSTAEKMVAAIEDATAVEVTTHKYMSMMNRDFKRFCKIMRLREVDAADKVNAPKKQRKITFADEAGGPLCHVKVFEEPSALAAMG